MGSRGPKSERITRWDNDLDCEVRLCPRCREWWPNDAEFYYMRSSGNQCIACRLEVKNRRPTPIKPRTHGSVRDHEAKKRRDRERKAELRRDPVFGAKMRERGRLTQQAYAERNRAKERERGRLRRQRERGGRPPRPGWGRPRLDDAA